LEFSRGRTAARNPDYYICLFIVLKSIVISGGQIVLLIRYLWESGGAKREQESALEIMKIRYARGEISKEEFEEKKKDL